MILGIGNDLIDIRRIASTLDRFGDRFVQRVFTQTERAKAQRRAGAPGRAIPGQDASWGGQLAATYAKRYAAKEACSKALGTGFSQGVFWRDIGVVNLETGQPTLCLTGGAQERLKALTPPGMVAHIHLTMTDEPPMAEAMVIITAEPRPPDGA